MLDCCRAFHVSRPREARALCRDNNIPSHVLPVHCICMCEWMHMGDWSITWVVDSGRVRMSSSRLSLADLCVSSLPPTPTTSMSSSPSSTPIHAGIKRPLTIDDQDEDVRIAVRALGDMRSRAVAHAHAPSAEAFAAAAKAHSRTCKWFPLPGCPSPSLTLFLV
jgi:hypothetical protein